MEPVVVNALHQAVERIREKAPGDQDGDRGNGQHSEGKEPGLPLPVRHFATNCHHCEKDSQRAAGHIQDRQENQFQDPAPFSGSNTLAQGCHGERQGQSYDCPGKRIVVAEKDHQQQGRDERKHIREQRLAAARRPDSQLDAAIQNGQQRRRLHLFGGRRLFKLLARPERALGREAEKIMLPMQPGDVYQTYADTTKLERELGYKPGVMLREGVDRFVAWYLSDQNPLR